MKVSIIIPVFNKWALTRACLFSLRASGLADAAEIIVVDNASSDETAQALPAEFPEVRHLRQETNLGFAGGNNLGAREARGELLMLLNNDTEVSPGWFDALSAVFAAQPRAGLVGGRLLYPNRRIQHAGVVFDHNRSPVHVFRNFPEDFAPAQQRRRYRAVTGACMLMPAALYRDLGGLDEAYRNGFEDIDFCLRLEQKGHEVWYEPGCRIVHHESQTAGRKLHDFDNHALFMSRWRDCIEPELAQVWRDAGLSPEAQAVHQFLLGCGEPQGYLPVQWQMGRFASDGVRRLVDAFTEECARLEVTVETTLTADHAGALGIIRPRAGALQHRIFVVEGTVETAPVCESVVRLDGDRLVGVAGIDSGREELRNGALMTSMVGFRSSGNSPATLLERGRALLGSPDGDAFVDAFAALFPHDVEPVILRAETAAGKGDVARAEDLYALCHQLDPRRTDVLLRLTDLMIDAGRRPQARKLLRQFLKVKPVHMGVHWRLLRSAWPGRPS